MRKATAILVSLFLLLPMTSCQSNGGTVNENGSETQYQLEFERWSGESTHQLPLEEGDELKIDIVCESGKLALTIRGEDGTEAYTGNSLPTGMFTVKAPAEDNYIITVTGKKLSGSLDITNLSAND